jgi:hypothetical protein
VRCGVGISLGSYTTMTTANTSEMALPRKATIALAVTPTGLLMR